VGSLLVSLVVLLLVPFSDYRRRGRHDRMAAGGVLMESEADLYDFDLTRFLHANRHPSSGRAGGHASLENALGRQKH
jgi:hypothetical protein